MSAQQHHQPAAGGNFTVPAILAFVLVFVLFVSMAQCHGPFEPSKIAEKQETPSYH